ATLQKQRADAADASSAGQVPDCRVAGRIVEGRTEDAPENAPDHCRADSGPAKGFAIDPAGSDKTPRPASSCRSRRAH
nr:hypothetical protein [Tanacetum cinerariifolium]